MLKRIASRKIRKRGGKTIVAAMLAAQMALAPALGALTPNIALADFEVPTKNATFTVRNVSKDAHTEYFAYRLFDASISSAEVDVAEGDKEWEDVGSYITWDSKLAGSDNAKRSAILTYLDEAGYPTWMVAQGIASSTDAIASDTREDPANAAGFIAYMITNRDGSLVGHDHSSDTDPELRTNLTSDGIDDYIWQENSYHKHYVPNDSIKNAQTYPRKIWARNGSSFALGLAKTLQGIEGLTTTGTWAQATTDANQPDEWTLTGDDGYYLIMTKKGTEGSGVIDASEAGTAPIWVALGGQTSEMTEKAIVGIQFDKDVAEDRNIGKSAGDATHDKVVWGKTADANTSQSLWYRLHGTLPTNLKSFSTYHYKFTDVLPAGTELSGTTGNVRVVLYNPTYSGTNDTGKFIDKAASEFLAEHLDRKEFVNGDGEVALTGNMVDITELATISYVDGELENAGHKVLTVDIANLLANLTGDVATNVSGDSVVAVYYQAHLTSDPAVVYGLDGNTGATAVGNQNRSKLTYSADPITMVDKDVASPDKTTQTYSYQLEVTKRDKVSGKELQGAKYTIQVADYDETGASVSGGVTEKGVSVLPNTDIDSAKKFVNHNGELVGAKPEEISLENPNASALEAARAAWDAACVFETDANGQFILKGLDEGIYIIKEIEPPKGTSAYVYKKQDDDIILTITSTLPADPTSGDQILQGFTATVAGGENKGGLGGEMYSRLGTYDKANRIHTTDVGITSYDSTKKVWDSVPKVDGNAASFYAPTIGDGKIQLLTADDRSVVLPITGMTGPQLAIIIGAVLIIVSGVGAYVVKRRRNSYNK